MEIPARLAEVLDLVRSAGAAQNPTTNVEDSYQIDKTKIKVETICACALAAHIAVTEPGPRVALTPSVSRVNIKAGAKKRDIHTA